MSKVSCINGAVIKQATPMDLVVGDKVHQHGAVFEVKEITRFFNGGSNSDCQANHSEWLEGNAVPGYFGPGIVWNIQGNELAGVWVETK